MVHIRRLCYIIEIKKIKDKGIILKRGVLPVFIKVVFDFYGINRYLFLSTMKSEEPLRLPYYKII